MVAILILEDYEQCEKEVLEAIGRATVKSVKGHPEISAAIFNAVVPMFLGRHPHQKILSELLLCEGDDSQTPDWIKNRGIKDA